jgi:hypothetical protein
VSWREESASPRRRFSRAQPPGHAVKRHLLRRNPSSGRRAFRGGVVPSPNGATLCQPRATPWVMR